MKDDLHGRARQLIDADRIEGLGVEDRVWLEAHLAACNECELWAARGEAALRALVNAPVPVPSGLAEVTSYRVRLEADRRKRRRDRNVALAVCCAVSWILGVASAPLVWKACAWVGAEFDLPRVVWVLGFAAWWMVPAAAGGFLILWQRDRLERESE